MATVTLNDALRTQYRDLFASCVVAPSRVGEIDTLVNGLAAHRPRYEAVADALRIPWDFIAVVHNMEASQNFACHLHNGDPLTARTVQAPAGRPKTGSPPFTWETSAVDALTMRGLNGSADWSLAGTLYQLEGYNGWGYRLFHPQTLSPYLWSFSNHYESGKFVRDGAWSPTAISDQCGAAVLLRRMVQREMITLADDPAIA